MTLQPVAAASGKEDMVVQVPQVPQERSEGGVGVGSLDLRSGMTATDATSPSTFVSDVGTAATEWRLAANALAWAELACHVPNRRRKGQELMLLQGVSGVAHSGELTAIIGPSGAGKSTLLDMLAHRKTIGRCEGRIAYNGQVITGARKMRKRSAYVPQEDSFHPTVTVLEAVLFQAHMRFGMDVPLAAKLERAREVISLAGLYGKENQHVGGRLPGGIMVRGLSGGEKRRLSLCCGIVEGPEVLFCDEPTSGLDSLAALKITQMLHRFAVDSGMVVVCTIHQPRQSIWELFSQVMVLAKGRQLFVGSPADAHIWFTSGLGLTLPPGLPLAEFIIDATNIDFDKSFIYGEEDEEEAKDPEVEGRERKTLDSVEDLVQAAAAFREEHPNVFLPLFFQQQSDSTAASPTTPTTIARRWIEGLRLWGFKFRVLLNRNCRIYTRNPGNVIGRFLIYAFVGVASGVFLFGIGRARGAHGAADMMGAIFFNLLGAVLFPYVSISLFLYDRQFYQGDNASGLYPPSAYFAANVLLEALFNTINGIAYSLIIYYMEDYPAFVQPTNPAWTLVGYLAIFVVINMATNAQVLFCSLASPNVELAFILSAAYTTLALLLSGSMVSFPSINGSIGALQYLSSVKFGFAAVMLHFFDDNTRAVTPFGTVDALLHAMRVDSPDTAGENVLGCLAIYAAFMLGAFLCLKYLYKEKR